jgi:hypothetical protein
LDLSLSSVFFPLQTLQCAPSTAELQSVASASQFLWQEVAKGVANKVAASPQWLEPAQRSPTFKRLNCGQGACFFHHPAQHPF